MYTIASNYERDCSTSEKCGDSLATTAKFTLHVPHAKFLALL